MVVRLSKSLVGKEEKDALARVIDGGYLGMGEEVRLFEEELAQYLGSGRQVVCVSTGTAALHMAIAALDIGPGDEVLVPSITYVASFQMISATGAKPVACDVRSEDVFLDIHDAEKRLTKHTRAIMPVAYASSAKEIDAVYAFAKANDLRVVEDAAHAFGCRRQGAVVGTEGDVICFSFDGIKNITCGEGGAVITADEQVAQRIRDGRLLGVEHDTESRYAGNRTWDFDVRRQGFRYHMSNMNAAVGREQLKKLPFFSERRQQLARRYCEELHTIKAVNILDLDWDGLVPHIFVIRVPAELRDGLRMHLAKCDIQTGLHYQPNHLLSLYADGTRLAVAEKLAKELVTIPLHVSLTDEEQNLVISEIRSFFQKV